MMKRTLLLTLCVLLLAGCAGQSEAAPASDFKPPASVQVILNVLTPQGSPTGEPVQLHIVDTVTGTSFNSEVINMQPSGTGSFAATLSVPPGTLLTYRYTRLSVSGSIDEVNASNQPVLYRSFLVTGAGHVAHDLIAAWADQPSELPTGQVAGQITSASGEPLAGIQLRASGLQTSTDAEGNFFFDGLTQGLHNIVVTDPGGRHQSFQQGALVAANSQTPASIQLQPAELAQVTFIIIPHASNPSGVPVYLLGNLGPMASQPVLSAHDGGYSLTLELPTGTDLRYKYTLGDGLWNAEHYPDGNFVLRQLIIPAGTTQLTVRDNLQEWSAGGSSGPIWFDLTAPDDGSPVYLQFKLLDWATALPMWNLGGGRHAYVLYSPTNFAEPLEYRYCRDAACTQPEVHDTPRIVTGNQPNTQQVQDRVTEWQSSAP